MKSKHERPEVILVTGGSSGLGRAICLKLVEYGHTVYGTSRKGGSGEGYSMLRMDITDEGSVNAAIAQLMDREGHIDVVVNNAGVGISGPTEGFPPELAAKAFDTNVLGAHRVCNAVLPYMRTAGKGRIVMITSLAADMGLAYRSFYCATKAALERYSSSLAMEVRDMGIDVLTVRPGDFRSNIVGARLRPPFVHDAYRARYERTMSVVDAGVAGSMEAEQVAAHIVDCIQARSPKTSYIFARPMERIGLLAKALLPGRLFERMLQRHFE